MKANARSEAAPAIPRRQPRADRDRHRRHHEPRRDPCAAHRAPDPIAIDLAHLLQRPSRSHWLGTDIQGRDIWSRLVYGARVSLTVGLISQGIALALGVTLGLVAGYYGKWVDEIVMRLADVTLAFPTLLLLIAMVAALQPSIGVVFATIGIVGWAGMARHRSRTGARRAPARVRAGDHARSAPAICASCCSTCCRTSSRRW